MDLERYGIHVRQIVRNPSPALLYESALRHERGTAIAASGALVAMSGARTGRSPADKRIVAEPGTRGDVWWGEVNIELDEHTFEINRERAIDYLNTLELLYVGATSAATRHTPRTPYAPPRHQSIDRPRSGVRADPALYCPRYVPRSVIRASRLPAGSRKKAMRSS